ncbi:hydroxyproline-rich glycoprotein family protein [Reticulomyxa filosa]|uniref:Hydroxyproline-rich glycoprotein family protein n=1 Tax=Reticulomyxa filosa TaxID=46433 RepID=X6NZW4_RETFI|nr:hydroxyproline-rich glycoprotein family protein [Reticulomyxa filosa]|eukprot:ETO31403.1 hydroxyproline-rich glycoprotein family protein [Reticulomyxa filosa]
MYSQNAARRAKEDANNPNKPAPVRSKILPRRTQKIGTPGYKVVKQKDVSTGQLSLLFRIHYSEIEKDLQPRHRFVSTFAQKVESQDKNYQYVLFAAEPYDTIGFKIPNIRIDKDPTKLLTHWNPDTKDFTLQMFFEATADNYDKYT